MLNVRENKLNSNGVYEISNDDYHNSLGISRTGLMEFNKTPFHYWNNYINPNRPPKKEQTSSMNFGSILHTYILENQFFNDRYLIIKKMDKRTKEGKNYHNSIEKEKGNKELITEEEFKIINDISNNLLSDNIIKELIAGARYEKSIYWEDPSTGLLCKVRPDIWHDNFIVDLKTSSDACLSEFQRSIVNYGYYLQSAMMQQAVLNVCGKNIKDFIYIVIENSYPYAYAIYKLDEFALEYGINLFKNKLIELKKCYEKNDWPSYKTQVITLPSYVLNRDI